MSHIFKIIRISECKSMNFVEMHVVLFCKSTKEMLLAGDELAQVVSCPWIMRDSGGSLAQNHWQGDLGLPAGRQDNAGGGNVDADYHTKTFNHKLAPVFA